MLFRSPCMPTPAPQAVKEALPHEVGSAISLLTMSEKLMEQYRLRKQRKRRNAFIAAIVIEPVQGEGGFYASSPAFMQRLRALCDEHGIMLIADEVQSGAGRTGTLFAMEQMGVAPDLTTFAKSIAGGFPLAGVTGRAEVMDAVAPGGLGGTVETAIRALTSVSEHTRIDAARDGSKSRITDIRRCSVFRPRRILPVS